VIIAHINITSRKKAEQERMRSEERFRSLMERSPLAIEILTPDGQISQVNDAWMRLWGVNETETAQTLANYNMLNDNQIVDLGIAPLVERAFSGQPVVLPPIQYHANRAAEEVGLEHIKARSRWIQCHLYSVKDANGEIDTCTRVRSNSARSRSVCCVFRPIIAIPQSKRIMQVSCSKSRKIM
jgi:PAS domain-containing protein